MLLNVPFRIRHVTCLSINGGLNYVYSPCIEVSRTPDTFFKHSFLANHCPLAFMKVTTDYIKNLTPLTF